MNILSHPGRLLRRCGQIRQATEPHALEPMEARQLLAADLVANSLLVLPSSINPGDDVAITVGLRNRGDDDAGAFRVQVRLSANQTFGDADDVVLGTFRRAGLDAGERDIVARSFDMPDNVEPGSYFVGVNVDSLQTVPEENESNNTRFTSDDVISVGDADESDIEVRGRGLIITDGDDSPRNLDGTTFGAVNVDGGARSRLYTIFNRGDANLAIDDISISGDGASSFEVIAESDDSVDPGEFATFRVRFNPDSSGVKNATVTIDSNDPDEASYSFAISGRGQVNARPSEIAVFGASEISDGDLTASTGDGTNFGVTTVGDFIDQTFTITNTGGRDLTLNSPFVRIVGRNPGRFSVISQPADTILGPGESTTFVVRFNASSPGTRKAIVQVLSNDSDEGVFDFEIRGRGHPSNGNG